MALTPEQYFPTVKRVEWPEAGVWATYQRTGAGYLGEGPDPVDPEEQRRVIAFAQQDARWKADRMGGVAQTVGGYGCAMVSACMVYSQVEPAITPGEFNRILTQQRGYNIIGTEAHLAWDRLPDIFPELEYRVPCRKDWTRLLTDGELADIFAMIDEAPLVLWVDFKPNVTGMQSHFVLATDHTETDVEIIDPWEGVHAWLLRRYGNDKPGDSLKRAIWGYRRLVVRS